MATTVRSVLERAEAFGSELGARVPILLAPMAGACPPSLSIAVASAGGLGACGALLLQPDAIAAWASEVRACTDGGFQLNLWLPDPPATRDRATEDALRAFLGRWGPEVAPGSVDAARMPDFGAQCEALLEARPVAISSIMGLFPAAYVARMKENGIRWFATATTVTEACAAEAAGADAIVAQGMEAGGHRGAFDPSMAEVDLVGLFSLLPAVVDAVKVPVIAAGGIADARGVAAALLLGASAVEIGTGFLRCPEARAPRAWSSALAHARPEHTRLTRAFSGRPGRALVTPYVIAAAAPGVTAPAPYPIQRALTRSMREAAVERDDLAGMQAWAGQSAAMASAQPAGQLLRELWVGACALLGRCA